MLFNIKNALIGAAVGFGVFVVSLEAPGMGNVIVRNGEFTPRGIIHFMKNPFCENYLWRPSLWVHNWIVTSSIGAFVGGLVG